MSITVPTNGYRHLVHRLILQQYTGTNGPGMRLGEREQRATVDEPVPSTEDELENASLAPSAEGLPT